MIRELKQIMLNNINEQVLKKKMKLKGQKP